MSCCSCCEKNEESEQQHETNRCHGSGNTLYLPTPQIILFDEWLGLTRRLFMPCGTTPANRAEMREEKICFNCKHTCKGLKSQKDEKKSLEQSMAVKNMDCGERGFPPPIVFDFDSMNDLRMKVSHRGERELSRLLSGSFHLFSLTSKRKRSHSQGKAAPFGSIHLLPLLLV